MSAHNCSGLVTEQFAWLESHYYYVNANGPFPTRVAAWMSTIEHLHLLPCQYRE
jgi:hypothetical protein